MSDTPRYRATNLREVIAAQGRKASWVAEQAGISRFLFSHVVAGRRTISGTVAEQVARTLETPLFLLFELSEDTETVSGEAA